MSLTLLDEATAALDLASEAVVARAAAQLTRRRTTLVVAHRLTTAARADRVLVLDGRPGRRGRLARGAAGRRRHLRRAVGLLRRPADRERGPAGDRAMSSRPPGRPIRMSSSVQAILVTRDLDRLAGFYRSLLDAVETRRVPPDGPTFFIGLRIGNSDLGVVADGEAPDGPQRMLLSVDVPDVDALLPRVEELGGHVEGPPNDMPWGQRVAHVQDPDGNSVNLTQDL